MKMKNEMKAPVGKVKQKMKYKDEAKPKAKPKIKKMLKKDYWNADEERC